MKKQLQKKFYAFIVTAMMFSASANAQIVYTDIIPDKTLSYGSYSLDLNNDGQSDFTFRAWYSFLSCAGGGCMIRLDTTLIKPTGLSWVSDYTNGEAARLNSGDSINESSPLWTNFQSQLLYNNRADCSSLGYCTPQHAFTAPHSLYSPGIWINVVDKYLALKIQVSGNIYYGWARLDAGGDGLDITIKDYAYNSIPNQPILAGQTTIVTGIIENSFASSINLFPNPAENHLTISLGSNNPKVELTISDLTGKVIYTTLATDTQKIEVNTKDFAEGIYVVQIQTADFIATKKLVVEK